MEEENKFTRHVQFKQKKEKNHIEQLSELSSLQNFTGKSYRSMRDKIFTQILKDHVTFTHDSNFYGETYREEQVLNR